MRVDYRTEQFQTVKVKGITCQFNDMRIDRSTIPKEKYVYEVASDDDGHGDPARIRKYILVNFFGTLICDREIPLEDGAVAWIMDGDWEWDF